MMGLLIAAFLDYDIWGGWVVGSTGFGYVGLGLGVVGLRNMLDGGMVVAAGGVFWMKMLGGSVFAVESAAGF